MSNSLRILFVHPEGNLANNPNLSAITYLLAKQGHRVTVCSPLKPFAQPPHPDVRVVAESPLFPPADVVVGVDANGLIEGFKIAQAQNATLVYLCYGIIFADEAYCPAALKAQEREAAAAVSFAISHDAVRARLLAEETGIPEDKILRMPVAGSGPRPGPRTRILHEQLGIQPDRKIAIFAGCIMDWTDSRRLVESSATWPDDWVLVMHERYGKEIRWLKAAQALQPKRVYISAGGLPTIEDLGRLLHASDLGIALYRATYEHISNGRNTSHIGLGSGKISTYLQHGLPVLVNEIGEMADHVREKGLGLVVRDTSEIADALRTFDPERHREQCVAFFREHLDAALFIRELEDAFLASVRLNSRKG